MITKTCRQCQIQKKAKEFPKGRDSNGLYYICKSCKVLNNTKLYRKKDPITRWVDVAISDIKGRAKKLGIAFDLTKEFLRELLNKQNGKCIYCDITCNLQAPKTDRRQSISIDRIIPQKGYTETNVVLCCYRCNAIKQDASLQELKHLVQVLETITTTNQNFHA